MSHLLSIVLLGEGLLTGILLTIMVGPVTMVILRSGIEVNRTAGVWTAIGTWVSDFVFITLTYWMTASIETWATQETNKFALYLIGGLGLLTVGLMMMRVSRTKVKEDQIPTVYHYSQAFDSGFIVNSLSPFTLFFWLGAAVFLHMQNGHPLYYYGGLMLTLGMGDFTKAWIAPKLTQWLKAHYVYWIQVIAGITIALTGVYIVYLGMTGKA